MDLAHHIKVTLGAQQLVMDGRFLSRSGLYPELSSPDHLQQFSDLVDIMTDHFYPLSLETLVHTAESVAEIGLPFVIGEIGWTKSDTLEFLEVVEQLHDDDLVAGDLFWSMFGHAESLGHVTHDDGYSLYWPNGPEPDSFHHNNPAYKTLVKNISDHMFRVSGRDVPETYLMSDAPPLITILDCKPQQWIRSIFSLHQLWNIVKPIPPIVIY